MAPGNWADAASTIRCASAQSRRWLWTSKLFRISAIRPGQYSRVKAPRLLRSTWASGRRRRGGAGAACCGRGRTGGRNRSRHASLAPGEEGPRHCVVRCGLRGGPGILQRPFVPAEAVADLPTLAVGNAVPGGGLQRLVQRGFGRLEETRAPHQTRQADPSLRILRAHLGQALILEECQLRVSLGHLERRELPASARVLRLQLQDGAKLGAGLVGVTGLQGGQGPGHGHRGALLQHERRACDPKPHDDRDCARPNESAPPAQRLPAAASQRPSRRAFTRRGVAREGAPEYRVCRSRQPECGERRQRPRQTRASSATMGSAAPPALAHPPPDFAGEGGGGAPASVPGPPEPASVPASPIPRTPWMRCQCAAQFVWTGAQVSGRGDPGSSSPAGR
jgi:hypothetical protein